MIDQTVDPMREVSLAFYVILVIMEFRISLFLWNAFRKNSELDFIGSIGLFFAFIALGRILLIIFDYYLTFMDYSLYEANFPFYKIATDLQAIGLGFFLYVTERSIFHGKDKYVFLIGYGICQFIATVILDFNLSQTWITIATCFVVFIPIYCIYNVLKAKGPLRTQAFFLLFGVIFFIAGALFVGEDIMVPLVSILGSRYAVHILAILAKMVGVNLVYHGFHLQIKN